MANDPEAGSDGAPSADMGSSSDLDADLPGQSESREPMVVTFTPATNEAPDSLIRKWVSYLLLALLSAIVVAAFLQLFLINAQEPPATDIANVMADNSADSERLMSLMNVVFGPIVTLFSSVVGFYFGARTAKEGGAG